MFRAHLLKTLWERNFKKEFRKSLKYISLLLKVILYLLIIFWKIRIDTLHEEDNSMKISPWRNSHPKNSHPLNSPWKIPPLKCATQKILIWNITTHFINCLPSINASFWHMFTNVKTSALLKQVTILRYSLLSNINDNDNNNEKKN